jgi:exocyst complex protein 7
MYEVCKELMPEINSIFRSENAISEARRVMDQIGEAARGCLQEFEVGIQKDSSRKAVPGGSFHPLTRYVMNYIKLLVVYTSSLEQLLRGRRREIPRSLGVETFGLSEGLSNEAEQLSPLAIQVMWLIVHLESNLEGKSKLYLDPSMSFLFLMNNTHYIVTKVKQSELVFLLKDRWIRKHSAQVRVYSSNYVNAAWQKVFSCLREEGLGSNARSGNNGISRFAIKDRLKNFNQTFDEVCAAQSSAIVPDPDLKEHLRLAIAEKLLPMYRTFCERYSNLLEGGAQSDKYFKYTYDDLENKIIDLFDSHP